MATRRLKVGPRSEIAYFTRVICRLLLPALLVCALFGGSSTTLAAPPPQKVASGRPEVRLDKLDLPAGLVGRDEIESHLRATLRRETRKASWGAGRDNQIEYRFSVTALEIVQVGDLLRVRCSALGQLPGGQKARSDLSFGGHPKERTALVHRVVDVVARGVVTRLAELEQKRRGVR